MKVHRQSWQPWLATALVVLWWSALWFLNGLNKDHFLVGAGVLFLYGGGSRALRLKNFLMPAAWTAIIYDSQRYYSDYIRGRIRVSEPYLFDKNFFGIEFQGQILTPNEWWQLHTHPALDIVTGFMYLVFVAFFIFFAAYFYFQVSRKGTPKFSAAEIYRESPRIMWAFLWLNILGYTTYYWYPAAPPWYVEIYGLGPADLSAQANAAGCLRFDQILGTHFFTTMYGKAADVFGAIPSLHVAYPLLAVYYAFKYGAARTFAVLFYILMCFSAVYLNHHYILDVIWGSVYAIIIGVGYDWYLQRRQARGT